MTLILRILLGCVGVTLLSGLMGLLIARKWIRMSAKEREDYPALMNVLSTAGIDTEISKGI